MHTTFILCIQSTSKKIYIRTCKNLWKLTTPYYHKNPQSQVSNGAFNAWNMGRRQPNALNFSPSPNCFYQSNAWSWNNSTFLFMQTASVLLFYFTLRWKWSFPLRISSVKQICKKLWIWSHILKKSLMENFIFCAVSVLYVNLICPCRMILSTK